MTPVHGSNLVHRKTAVESLDGGRDESPTIVVRTGKQNYPATSVACTRILASFFGGLEILARPEVL